MPLAFVAWLASTAWGFYQFKTGTDSPLFEKNTEIQTVRAENDKLQIRARELKKFVSELERKKTELRGLAQKLDESKANLSETFDVPSFMQSAVTEAKRLGLQVMTFRPTDRTPKELYGEQGFEFGFRGAYVQLLVFLHRLAQIQTIVRVENFNAHPFGARTSKYVMLEGSMQIKGYYYLRSKADDVSRQPAAGKPAAPAAKGDGA